MDRLPHVITIKDDLRSTLATVRQRGETIALVPTMGALHEGHLRLVEAGRARCARVVVSIFVNPTQFAANEDFGKYPRVIEEDLKKLARKAVYVVWAPTVGEMYPQGFSTRVVPAGAADGLESDFRPHFFGGVATVCCKLFSQVQPDIACFGEKDFQQLAVVRQMVRDLDLPLEIVGVPTVREPDGLAMSSRNRYLSAEERQRASLIFRVMSAAAAGVKRGDTIAGVEASAAASLAAAGFRVDYVAIRDSETLERIAEPSGRRLRVLIAAWNGATRLIDNMEI